MSFDFGQNAEGKRLLERDAEWMIPVYARYPVVMDHGDGVYLWDTSGNRYLDLMAGLGVNALGHAHPRMLRVMAEQAARLIHLSPQYAHRATGDLAERLCGLSGLSGCFYSTGGSEAVEGALKLARTHARQNWGHTADGEQRKREIVALHGSYHGRTYGSLSVTGQDKYRLDFGPGIPHVRFVHRNDVAELRAAVGAETAAILLEPVMGEGGVFTLDDAFMHEARALADKHGALLIFDEIQCGLGRTGAWFAFERTGVRPDMLILGKPLGGGLPLSALLVNDDLFHSFGLAKHGSTLGGSPFACTLGLEFLNVVESDALLARVADTGAHLLRGLQAMEGRDVVVEARGAGLLAGLELRQPARPIVEAALAAGYMLNVVQGNVVRFLPSFLLERTHVDEALDVLGALIGDGDGVGVAASAENASVLAATR